MTGLVAVLLILWGAVIAYWGGITIIEGGTRKRRLQGLLAFFLGTGLAWVALNVYAQRTQEPEPLSQSEIILAIEEASRLKLLLPMDCEPVSPTEINCTLTVDPKAE